jgi:hypothetical protein
VSTSKIAFNGGTHPLQQRQVSPCPERLGEIVYKKTTIFKPIVSAAFISRSSGMPYRQRMDKMPALSELVNMELKSNRYHPEEWAGSNFIRRQDVVPILINTHK